MPRLDAVIVGAGPAGLSAALVLGRCRRSVVVIDNGAPRNSPAVASHGFLTRDGIAPSKLLRLGRAELQAYPIELHRRRSSWLRQRGPSRRSRSTESLWSEDLRRR